MKTKISNTEILNLQTQLNRLGYNCPLTGELAPSTVIAFKKYSNDRKIDVLDLQEITIVPTLTPLQPKV